MPPHAGLVRYTSTRSTSPTSDTATSTAPLQSRLVSQDVNTVLRVMRTFMSNQSIILERLTAFQDRQDDITLRIAQRAHEEAVQELSRLHQMHMLTIQATTAAAQESSRSNLFLTHMLTLMECFQAATILPAPQPDNEPAQQCLSHSEPQPPKQPPPPSPESGPESTRPCVAVPFSQTPCWIHSSQGQTLQHLSFCPPRLVLLPPTQPSSDTPDQSTPAIPPEQPMSPPTKSIAPIYNIPTLSMKPPRRQPPTTPFPPEFGPACAHPCADGPFSQNPCLIHSSQGQSIKQLSFCPTRVSQPFPLLSHLPPQLSILCNHPASSYTSALSHPKQRYLFDCFPDHPG